MEDFNSGGFVHSTPDESVEPGTFPLDEIPDNSNELGETIPEARQNGESADGRQEDKGVLEQFPMQVISGAAGEFARLYSAHMEPPIEFFYMAFLTCLGSVLADRLTLASEIKVQPRLYVLLLGQSADDRKSTAIDKTIEFFDSCFSHNIAEHLTQLDFNACYGVGSAEGLQKRLDAANKTILAYDEFKAFIGKCKGQCSVLLPCVNTLFELNKYENHTKTTSFVLRCAYLCILAASTIETYNRTWEPEFTDIGFTNRIFIVPAKGESRFPVPRKIPDSEKERVSHWLTSIMYFVDQIPTLDMTEGAKARYNNWYNNRERSIHTKRLDTYALRLMLLLAVNDFKTEIDEETVEKVLALVDWQLEMRRQYDPIDVETKIAQLEEGIRRQLRARGPLTMRNLRRHTNADRAGLWAFEKALQGLTWIGDVVLDSQKKIYELVIDD